MKAENTFISELYVDGVIIMKNSNSGVYFDSYKYLNSINIEIDTIAKLPIIEDYVIFKFTLGKNKISLVSDNIELNFNSSSCSTFIIAINVINRKSYKLKGFSKNDILFLLDDLKKYHFENYNLKKIAKQIQSYTSELDFLCMYNSLVKNDLESDCLISCNEPKISHKSR